MNDEQRESMIERAKGRATESAAAYEAGRREERGEWIPVSERLPTEAGEYVVTMKTPSVERFVTTKYFYAVWACKNRRDGSLHPELYREHWLPSKSSPDQYVIAWMPLPEPYKSDDTK